MLLESGDDGTLADGTGQRAFAPTGVVEESKSESLRLKWGSADDKPRKRAPKKKGALVSDESGSDAGALAAVKLAQKNVVRNGG
jgi:hypothetical protein